ncbi:MAG: hypothetical protein ACI4E1_03350 [Lachnospira sp.]
MSFSDRLIILMDITKITNKSLAEMMHVDPSRISQLRTGRRGMPKNKEMLDEMGLLFAQKCDSESKRVALSEAIGRVNLKYMTDKNALADVISGWLKGERRSFSDVSLAFSNMTALVESSPRTPRVPDTQPQFNHTYYGNVGKRDAFIHAFQIIANLPDPMTIYINTDEAPDWYYEDIDFLSVVKSYQNNLLKRGFKIKQIIRPSNIYNQAYDSMIFWLPFYLTGMVEPYYYPRLRDGVIRQTFLVAPGVVSLHSISIGNKVESYYTLLSTDPKQTVLARDLFVDYLNVCEPTMVIYKTPDEIINCFKRFGSIDAPKISKCLSLSPSTLPVKETQFILDHLPDNTNQAQIKQILEAMKKHTTVTNHLSINIDICPLAKADEVRKGHVRMLFPGWSMCPAIYYTTETYVLHLKNIIHLLETYENYHFVPIEYDPNDNQTIFTRKNREVILVKNEEPFMVFDVQQPDMITIFQEYLLRMADKINYLGTGRYRIINQLKDLINELVI